MLISTLKQALPFLMQANIAPMLVGHHGVGKTQSVGQFCDEKGYMMKTLNLGTQEVGDLIGLADFEECNETGRKISTRFISPDWLTEVHDFATANPDKWAFVFLDELNRARRDVLQAIFPLVLEKRMHMVQLPKNVFIIGAMNPSTEDYVVTDLADKALLDRFCFLKVTPSKPEWFEYADHKGFDGGLLGFLREQPELLDGELEEFTLDEIKPSRRSWEAVDRLLGTKAPDALLKELSTGLVGSPATTAMIKSLKHADKAITAGQVLEKFTKTVKEKIKKYADTEKGGRIDLLKSTCDNLIRVVNEEERKLTKKEETNLSDFLLMLPKDMSFDMCRKLYRKPFGRGAIDNSEELKALITGSKKIILKKEDRNF